jgi:hypothetical protein
MNTINTILSELFGLFVDDGSLAVGILALLAVIALLVFEAIVTTNQAAVLLVAGNIALLVGNVLRSSARA